LQLKAAKEEVILERQKNEDLQVRLEEEQKMRKTADEKMEDVQGRLEEEQKMRTTAEKSLEEEQKKCKELEDRVENVVKALQGLPSGLPRE
jgi:predicted  nucleic acid-binding Zn-ribbon protein